MHDSADYRVLDRKKFAVIMVILLSLVAVGVWIGLDRLAEYADQLKALAADEPLEAGAIITQLLRALSVINGMVLALFAALIIRHGWRGRRTAAMPPKGSWILEGQRTWSGEPALRIAKFTIVVGVLLAVIGLAGSLILWRVGQTVTDQTLQHSGR